MSHSGFILTLSYPDQPGIVHAVSGLLFEQGCNILDSDQYGDEFTNRFFIDRKSTRLNSSHIQKSRMPSSA